MGGGKKVYPILLVLAGGCSGGEYEVRPLLAELSLALFSPCERVRNPYIVDIYQW